MKKKRTRRLMGACISPMVLEDFLKKGKIEIIESPIPDTAKYVSSHYDFERDAFIVYFSHSSFPELLEGEVIPYFNLRTFKYNKIKEK